MKNKMFLFLTIFVCLNHCRHYFLRDTAPFELTNEESSTLQSKKIGFVGFHPFYNHRNSENSNYNNPQLLSQNLIRTLQFVFKKPNNSDSLFFDPNYFVSGHGGKGIEQRLSHDSTAKQYLKSQKIDKEMATKPDKTIPEENLRIFLKTYLEKSKHLGHKEIVALLDFSDKNKIYLKQNNFEYWVIGFHSPKDTSFPIKLIISFYPSTLTLGILPLLSDDEVQSNFWIFDKKLNLIKKFEFQDEYIFIAASWIFWYQDDPTVLDGSIPIRVYEPDVKELAKELVKIIRN